MRLMKEDDPVAIQQYAHIKPAPVFGQRRCFMKCPGSWRTCTLALGHKGAHVAHTLFRKIAAVWDNAPKTETASGAGPIRNFLMSRKIWRNLPPEFLSVVASRFSSENAVAEFVRVCEESGILKNNIVALAELAEVDPEFALGAVAIPLTSYANAIGRQNRLSEARNVLRSVLTINPRHVPAWSSMALACFLSGDRGPAVTWADRVLSWTPDPNSTDIWERSEAKARTPEGEAFARKALDEPDIVGSWKELQHQMQEIKTACGKPQ